MLLRNGFDILGDKTMGQVGMRRRIGRNGHQLAPRSTAVTGLFKQLPSGGGERRGILRIANPGTQFHQGASQTVPVLTNENELPIAGNRNRIHPFRIFENVVFGNRIPVRQHDGFPAHRKPRTVEKILALQYFHFFLFGHFTLFKRNGKFTQNFPGCKTISGNRTDTGKSGTKNVILRGKPRQKQNLSRFSIYLRIFAANL